MKPRRIGRYRVETELGEGANGVVFAVTGHDGEHLALKRLHADHTRLADIKREFRVVADLYHRNLVLPHALEADAEATFFTMELVNGVTWTTWVHEAPPTARAGRLREALVQLCSGLSALHAHGLVHRDIKPSNVLVEHSGRVAILDFGMTQPALQEGPGGFSGTPAYGAPEVLWGGPATPASDAYSVGVLIHEAHSGSLPFDADPQRSVARRLEGKLPRLTGWPEDLERICCGLLEPDPSKRWTLHEVLGSLHARSTGLAPVERFSPFVGRERELETLGAAWRAAVDEGRTVLVDIVGRSGMGKSALLREFVRERASDAWVLQGRSYERDAVPYKAIDAAMDELERKLRQLEPAELHALVPDDAAALHTTFPLLAEALGATEQPTAALQTVEPSEQRRRSSAALSDLLARVGAKHGLVLALDDVQWGDLDSARLLVEFVAARPPRCIILAAHREETVGSAFVDELERIRQFLKPVEVVVDPLSRDTATILARSLCGGDARRAESIVERADGCPFMLELLASSEQGADESTEQALEARLAGLSPEARGVLEAICLASKPIERNRVPMALHGDSATWTAWAALSGARLIRSTNPHGSDAVEPYHDRIRLAVSNSLGDEQRAEVHRRLGASFAEEPVDAKAAAMHYELAGDTSRARPHARSAARVAREMLAFDHAVRSIELAVRCADPADTAELDQLELELALTLVEAGRAAEAAPKFLALAERRNGPEALDLRRQAMEHFLVAGLLDQGTEVMNTLLHELGVELPPRRAFVQGLMLVELGRLLMRGPRMHPEIALTAEQRLRLATFLSIGKGLSSYDGEMGAWFFLRAARMALGWGVYDAGIRGLAYTASVLGFVATDFALERAKRWISAGEQIAGERNDDHGRAICGVARGMVACCTGAWRVALEAFDDSSLALVGLSGSRWEWNTARAVSLLALMQLGMIYELEGRSRSMALDAQRSGEVALFVESSLFRALPTLADDEPALALETIDQCMRSWRVGRFLLQDWSALRFRTLAHLYGGDGESALRGLEAELPQARAARVLSVQILRIEAADLRGRSALAVAMGEAGSARNELLREVEREAERLERERCAYARAPASLLRAGVALARGHARNASTALEYARSRFDAADMPLHASVAWWHLAQLTGDAVERRRAEAAMRDQGVRRPSAWAAMHLPVSAER
jgi:eukaryotic-like serine/threonine-protein kinase